MCISPMALGLSRLGWACAHHSEGLAGLRGLPPVSVHWVFCSCILEYPGTSALHWTCMGILVRVILLHVSVNLLGPAGLDQV